MEKTIVWPLSNVQHFNKTMWDPMPRPFLSSRSEPDTGRINRAPKNEMKKAVRSPLSLFWLKMFTAIRPFDKNSDLSLRSRYLYLLSSKKAWIRGYIKQKEAILFIKIGIINKCGP
jgi:hypothetical protein